MKLRYIFLFIFSIIFSVLATYCFFMWKINNKSQNLNFEAATSPSNTTIIQLPNFSKLYQEVSPAVVLVKPFFENHTPTEDLDIGLGSGFFFNPQGQILTNAHVVKDAKYVKIKTSNNKEYNTKLLGLDLRTDLALLQVIKSPLDDPFPYLKIGNSEELNVGDWVMAIGSPFGFQSTATVGILSAKGRFLPDESYFPFLQTDAAVNPGNSGGPLFNLQGSVVGINSQIYSKSGGSMGLSFAIPIEHAVRIAQKLIKYGKIDHGKIGAILQELTEQDVIQLGLPSKHGALIVNVESQSSAQEAGLLPGDVITQINQIDIKNHQDFAQFIANTDPQTTLTLTVNRQGSILKIKTVVQSQ